MVRLARWSKPAATPIRAVGIFKRYGRSFPWVLHDLDLLLEPGSLTEIVGANGSGKSTLLRVLVGVTRPTKGGIATRPAEVGYVPERLPARVRMTGRIYLGHMARLRGLDSATANPRLETLTEAFRLQPGLDTPVAALSKGNRQKILFGSSAARPRRPVGARRTLERAGPAGPKSFTARTRFRPPDRDGAGHYCSPRRDGHRCRPYLPPHGRESGAGDGGPDDSRLWPG